MRKLRSKRGESLVETLCAVLVTALAVALLAAMVNGASRLDRKTAKTASEMYQAVSKAEAPSSNLSTYPTESEGTVSVKVDERDVGQLDVKFYGHGDQVVSYRGETEASTP